MPVDKFYILILLVITQFVNIFFGNVQLSFPFSDNMVLQREMNTPIRGTAAAGKEVTVTFNGQTHSTTADNEGKWEILLGAKYLFFEILFKSH